MFKVIFLYSLLLFSPLTSQLPTHNRSWRPTCTCICAGCGFSSPGSRCTQPPMWPPCSGSSARKRRSTGAWVHLSVDGFYSVLICFIALLVWSSIFSTIISTQCTPAEFAARALSSDNFFNCFFLFSFFFLSYRACCRHADMTRRRRSPRASSTAAHRAPWPQVQVQPEVVLGGWRELDPLPQVHNKLSVLALVVVEVIKQLTLNCDSSVLPSSR